MKFTLELEGPHPVRDIAHALRHVASELDKSFKVRVEEEYSHTGPVKLSGWLTSLVGTWTFKP